MFKWFNDLEFYRPPIILEITPPDFLGFVIDTSFSPPHLIFKQPTELWQFRSPYSAGSDATRVSGFGARLRLIKRYGHPNKRKMSDAVELCYHYLANLYRIEDLNKLMRKLFKVELSSASFSAI